MRLNEGKIGLQESASIAAVAITAMQRSYHCR